MLLKPERKAGEGGVKGHLKMSVYSCPIHRYVRRERPGICHTPTLSIVRCASCATPRLKTGAPDQCVCGDKLSVSDSQCGKALQLVEATPVEEY